MSKFSVVFVLVFVGFFGAEHMDSGMSKVVLSSRQCLRHNSVACSSRVSASKLAQRHTQKHQVRRAFVWVEHLICGCLRCSRA